MGIFQQQFKSLLSSAMSTRVAGSIEKAAG